MSDTQFHELLGDDGEFLEPIDTRFGVYSVHRQGYWMRVSITMGSLLGCAISGFILWAVVLF